ncbi:hypothetical protein A5647_07985 [Mycobacterium sp. 1100029.7]|nr:hypothetical protein A5647_07985 [Mycobacterium sp. 1100029.7]
MPLYKSNFVSRTIGVEEHFATRALIEGGARGMAETQGYETAVSELLDVAAGRIAAMDRAGMGMQVLSLTAPGIEPLEPAEAVQAARAANDELAKAVRAWPGRFAGLAVLPTSDPEAAAEELARAVGEGFVGAVISGHSRGRYLDNPVFDVLFAAVERLNVPLFLHPTPPPPAVIEAAYSGEFSADVRMRFAGSGWGWHHETGTHALRMIFGGVFDRFPDLQIILGHHGETIPMLLPRIERNFPQSVTGLDHSLRHYLQSNFYYTFGGWNWMSMFTPVQRLVGADRILFSTDYPFSAMEEGHEFLGLLEVGDHERELIAHGNAERLFRIPPRPGENP